MADVKIRNLPDWVVARVRARAERLDATLITADEKFAAEVRRKYPRVRALASFRTE